MNFGSNQPEVITCLLGFTTSRGGFVEVRKTVTEGLTHCAYVGSEPYLVALGCVAAFVLGCFLRRHQPFGWILMIGALLVCFLTVPVWLQEQVSFDDVQLTRVKSRWCLPHTLIVQWDELERVAIINEFSSGKYHTKKSSVEFHLKSGEIVDWCNISSSPLVGEVIDEIFKYTRERGIPVDSSGIE